MDNDTLTIVRTELIPDLLGSDQWEKGDIFVFAGFSYEIGDSYGDYTEVSIL